MIAANAILVAFASLNQVHRVRRRLAATGCYLELVRVPKSAGLPGCGYGVMVSRDELLCVQETASAFGIVIAGVFVSDGARWIPA